MARTISAKWILLSVIGLACCGNAFAEEPAEPVEEAVRGPTATFALGLGGGVGGVDAEGCKPGLDCDGIGIFSLGSARFSAFLGPITVAGRFVTDLSRDHSRAERAGLIGIRPGNSSVSLMLGRGKIVNANSRAKGEISVVSWEILIAPHGRHAQFIIHGASGDAGYLAFSFAAAFGSQ